MQLKIKYYFQEFMRIYQFVFLLLLSFHLDLFITSQSLFWFRLLYLVCETLVLHQLLLVLLLRYEIADIAVVQASCFILLAAFSAIDCFLKFGAEIGCVIAFIHFIDYSLPLPVFNLRTLYSLALLTDFLLTLQSILLSQNLPQHIWQAFFDMRLHESKLFVTFVLQYLRKKRDFMIISEVSLDSLNQGTCPLNYECLEPILLIEVSIHELFHCFNSQIAFSAFDVIFHFLRVHVADDVL